MDTLKVHSSLRYSMGREDVQSTCTSCVVQRAFDSHLLSSRVEHVTLLEEYVNLAQYVTGLAYDAHMQSSEGSEAETHRKANAEKIPTDSEHLERLTET